MSTFGGFSVGLSGLQAAQRALDVAGDNIANQATVGYTRRRVDTAATGAAAVPATWATSSSTGGVTVTGTTRISDDLIDARLASASGDAALAAGQQTTATSVESLFDEPGDNGLQAQLSGLWSSFHDVANNPTDPGVRDTVTAAATQVTDTLRRLSGGLATLYAGTRDALAASVASANGAISGIASLNGSIAAAVNAGQDASALQDQRDRLMGTLAQTVGATRGTDAKGMLTVFVGGTAVVSGTAALALAAAAPGDLSQAPGAGAAVTLAATGSPVAVTGGAAGASLQALRSTLPGRRDSLDAVASSLAQQVNALQATGYDASGQPGTPFFTGTTAATITVALSSGAQVAASGVAPAGGVASRDASVAQAMGELGSTGAADPAYRQLVSSVGASVQQAASSATATSGVVTILQDAHDSVSGVSVDEETASLVQFQRAYEGSAKYLSVLNTIFDSLLSTVTG